jgi:hypothetical protein
VLTFVVVKQEVFDHPLMAGGNPVLFLPSNQKKSSPCCSFALSEKGVPIEESFPRTKKCFLP